MAFSIRQCPSCGFRFPAENEARENLLCPQCRRPTQVVSAPFSNAKQIGNFTVPATPPIEAMLDNIRSAWNVGSMFRSADGAGLRHLHLCGITPTPNNPKTAKTALGAENSIPWSYHPNGLAVVENMKAQGQHIWGLEADPRAISIFSAAHFVENQSILLVVGNETSGIDPEILSLCDEILAIPMQGIKSSLNVAIAFGIAVYALRFGSQLNLS